MLDWKRWALTLVLAVSLVGFALAQVAKKQAEPFRDLFLELDANHDNAIERDEVPASARPSFERLLKRGDDNHNGKLEAEEYREVLLDIRAFNEQAKKKAVERFKGMDKDNKPVPELEGLPFVVLPVDEADTQWALVVVGRRDRDKDGKLDAKEAGLPIDVFATLDTDRDKKLSAAELAAWRGGEPAARFTIRLGKRAKDRAAIDLVKQQLAGFEKLVRRMKG